MVNGYSNSRSVEQRWLFSEYLCSCWYKCIKNVWDTNIWVTCKINLCYLLKGRMKITLNKKIEFKMKYLKGKSMLMKNFMNRHFKSEWIKIVLCSFLTKVNIWKFSRTILTVSIVVSLILLIMYTTKVSFQQGSVVRYQVMQQIW